MDEEAKQEAFLRIKNAFWEQFSELCHIYIEVGSAFVDNPEEQLGDLTSIYGIAPKKDGANVQQR
jgi:hypothetical protein